MSLYIDITKRLKHFTLSTSFSCHPGQLTAIVGPSGAGKTSLIRLIAGLEAPDTGTLFFNNTPWVEMHKGYSMPTNKRKIGLVFQEYTLFPHMDIRQNINFGASNTIHIDELMHTFGIYHLRRERPHSISGGERQRAAFCQALASQPDLLLLDEPFSALDVKTRSFLCGLLADLKTSLNIPIIHVTHDLREANLLGDAIMALENGQIAPDWLSRQYHLHNNLLYPNTSAYL
ncbi:ATP-binding cassette domain-containing protein [Pseudodesulfovibrio piezophilus]|uniref:ABC transporter related protein n=1 Tax=Pseudodesulfovibrio piezophilus (strain DSM 21447 / JCM 15486 / C1TLV30) TaxID=1322246 RepID=M1WLX3_PSEP2|nr:ATP-binding cassette domain-containing protein [Pseudodesulfovibrio piezophilus]CCH48610.1 ABC transporter related protein [Pseudodesulfovibrio piezophilus C1TLV30]